jgi:hypothetical protein
MSKGHGLNTNHKHKSSDGGLYVAIAGFLLLIFYFYYRSEFGRQVFPNQSQTQKLYMLLGVLVLAFYGNYRRLRNPEFHSHVRRELSTMLILINYAFSIPGIIIYLLNK